ncbi:MAG: hypothetical protein GX219_06960 [Tissierellia bacterium]|nr:hypothetical protein [Tissierellia bacterium]
MLCQICNKNEAVIHMTTLNDGKPEEIHICEKCAKERGEFKFGIGIPVGITEDGFELPFSLDDFFNNFVKNIFMNEPKMNMYNPNTNTGGGQPHVNTEALGPGCDICMHCGMTLKDYLISGEGNCEKCYEHFRPRIVRHLDHYMRNQIGFDDTKERREIKLKLNEVLRLKSDLEISVALEDYEQASKIRDRILAITNNR